jgi:ribosome-binding protein aMBF1 (putative translation factor)
MIQNELQYRVTKARMNEFLETKNQLESETLPKRARAVRAAALQSLIEELQTELEAFEHLRDHQEIPDFTALEHLADDLIRARIAAGLTHAGLAERLGMKPQQIQRYESTRYAGASLSRVLEVARAIEGRSN